MLVRSLPMRSRNRFTRDVIHTDATHARHAHDVTDMVKMAAPTIIFLRLPNVDSRKLDPKSVEKVFIFKKKIIFCYNQFFSIGP